MSRWGVGAISLLSLLGAGVSAYLTLASVRGLPLYCLGSGCELVLTSSYARLGPLPVALLGLGMYLAVLGLTLSYLRASATFLPLLGVFALSLTGAIYSAYLTYISATAIGAFCTWCLTSAGTVTAIFVLTAILIARSPRQEGDTPE